MAKFIVGVLLGLYLGSSATAYGAAATRSGTLSGWKVTKNAKRPSSLTDLTVGGVSDS